MELHGLTEPESVRDHDGVSFLVDAEHVPYEEIAPAVLSLAGGNRNPQVQAPRDERLVGWRQRGELLLRYPRKPPT